MTTIGFIGTGHIGGQIARAVASAGHDVVLSNASGPDALAPLVAELGSRARAAAVDEAAADGDPVVVAIPLRAFPTLPAAPLGGKVVIVTSNYNIDREGRVAALEDHTTTVPGLLQSQLPASLVVRAFSHISSPELTTDGRRRGARDRRALAFATDHSVAGQVVASLYDEIGFDSLDLGGLDEAWRIDRGQPAFIARQNLAQLRENVARADRSRSGH
jgi:8-hydroxy-5-deazaflavin:NADPH oxidoreductase